MTTDAPPPESRPETSPPDASPPGAIGGSRIGPFIAAAAVLAVVGAGAWFGLRFSPTINPLAAAVPGEPDTGAPRPGLIPGHDYYLHVRTLEAQPSPDDRDHWDRVGHSGPDLYFELHWQGNRLFTSPQRTDALVATWDLLSVDVREVIANAGEIDVESIINAPVIPFRPGGPPPELRVYDDDPLSGDDDLGTFTLDLDASRPGRNRLRLPADAPGGLTRIEYLLVDRDIALPDLIALISNR